MFLLFSLLAKLPLGMLHQLARWAAWLLNTQQNATFRRVIRTNFALLYPLMHTQDREKLEKQNILYQCYSALESFKVWGSDTQYAKNLIKQVYHIELITQALAAKKGIIFVVPHLGTWEVMNAWLNQFGAMTIMYKPAKNAAVNQFILTSRQRLNSTLVPTDDTGVRAIFKTLKQGGLTAILPDHVPEHESGGVYASFFGYHTLSSTLVAKLAQKTQCAVIGLSCIRNTAMNGFDVRCYAMSPNIYDTNIETATSALNQSMEQMITPYISHYIWSYKRFKKTQGFANIYHQDLDDVIRTAQNIKST